MAASITVLNDSSRAWRDSSIINPCLTPPFITISKNSVSGVANIGRGSSSLFSLGDLGIEFTVSNATSFTASIEWLSGISQYVEWNVDKSENTGLAVFSFSPDYPVSPGTYTATARLVITTPSPSPFCNDSGITIYSEVITITFDVVRIYASQIYPVYGWLPDFSTEGYVHPIPVEIVCDPPVAIQRTWVKKYVSGSSAWNDLSVFNSSTGLPDDNAQSALFYYTPGVETGKFAVSYDCLITLDGFSFNMADVVAVQTSFGGAPVNRTWTSGVVEVVPDVYSGGYKGSMPVVLLDHPTGDAVQPTAPIDYCVNALCPDIPLNYNGERKITHVDGVNYNYEVTVWSPPPDAEINTTLQFEKLTSKIDDVIPASSSDLFIFPKESKDNIIVDFNSHCFKKVTQASFSSEITDSDEMLCGSWIFNPRGGTGLYEITCTRISGGGSYPLTCVLNGTNVPYSVEFFLPYPCKSAPCVHHVETTEVWRLTITQIPNPIVSDNPYFRKITQTAGLNNTYVKNIYVKDETVKTAFIDSSTYDTGLNITRWSNIPAAKWLHPVPLNSDNPYFRKVTNACGLNNSYVRKIYVKSGSVKNAFLDSSNYDAGLNITKWNNVSEQKWVNRGAEASVSVDLTLQQDIIFSIT